MSALPGELLHAERDAREDACLDDPDSPGWANVPRGTDLLADLLAAVQRARESRAAEMQNREPR